MEATNYFNHLLSHNFFNHSCRFCRWLSCFSRDEHHLVKGKSANVDIYILARDECLYSSHINSHNIKVTRSPDSMKAVIETMGHGVPAGPPADTSARNPTLW